MLFKKNKIPGIACRVAASSIGIGTPLTGRPSHTTQRTGPYCAIRLIKAESNPGERKPT